MPRDGSGNVTISQYPVTAFTLTDAATQNAAIEDIRQMIEGSVPTSGVKAASADLPMGGFKHTGVGNANARTNYAAVGQLQDGSLTFGGSVGGTGDATTLNLTPAITAYVAGQRISYLAPGTNSSTAPTLNVNGLGAKTIKRPAGAVLFANDILVAQLTIVEYDGAAFILLNATQVIQFKGKLSDTTRTATATPAADPELASIAATPGMYMVEAYLLISQTGGTNGFQGGPAFSGTAVSYAEYIKKDSGGLAASGSSTYSNVDMPSLTTGFFDWIKFFGSFEVTVGGNFSINWAQSTSGAGTVKLSKGSWLRVTRVS